MSTLTCPSCGSQKVVKNGRIHNGKQNHKCRACDRQFVEAPQQKRIDPHTKALIDKLLNFLNLKRLWNGGKKATFKMGEHFTEESLWGKMAIAFLEGVSE